jgi:mono/diheme cytochrome c family protein
MIPGKRMLHSMLALIVIGALAAVLGGWISLRTKTNELLRREPDRLLGDAQMLQLADRLARPLYQVHCAVCHGRAFQGDPARGVPDLAKHAWLYGNNPVDVEHTILYGIRSGIPRRAT